jgi:hypothetical protein
VSARPASSVKAFEVYHLGDSEADIREGQDFPKLWAKWHYDWSTPGTITLTVVESDAIAPGSGATMTATPNLAGRHFGARSLGPHIKERHRVAGYSHDAGHRSPILGVLFQEGVRRPVTSPARPAGRRSSLAAY